MKSDRPPSDISRRVLLSSMALLPALSGMPVTATAQQVSGFSFAVYGDSRPMMYLPSKDGSPDLNKLFVEMFGLVLPEKVAEEVVKKDVKMIFDPVTKELIKVVMPFVSKSEVMTLTVDKGWVTEASVEDVKLLPGVHRTMFRLQGGEWVAREIVKDVQSGRAKFVVNSGDVVWWGNQGRTVADSPYWKRVNDTMLKQLPPPDSEMRAAGLGGPVVHGGRQSRGVGRSQDRGRAERCAVSEEVSASRRTISSTSSTSTAPASSICGAASTTTGRPRCGMAIGRSMRSR